MTLITILKKRLRNDKSVAVSAGSGGGACGPGLHRHPDVYHDKCHPIEQHHRGTDYSPNKKTPGDETRKMQRIKKYKLKRLQLGRPL